MRYTRRDDNHIASMHLDILAVLAAEAQSCNATINTKHFMRGAVITAKLLSIYRHKQTGMLNIQKRREDACAVRKLARNTMSVFRGFRTKCFWSAMRPRIAFMGTNAQLFLCALEDRTKHTAFDA